MAAVVQKRVYSCWMLIEPAEDVAGLWVSHCLNFDVISQGDSPVTALESLREAVSLTVVDDLVNGRDPQERAAPEEMWKKLERVVKNGKPINLAQVSPDQKVILATNETLVVNCVDHQPAVTQMPLVTTPPVSSPQLAA